MAALDNDHLVVRIVYTGPPLAGKTQSVRALMPLLRGKGAERAVVSPGEWRGRTAFFDWADYEGGAYDGKPIRCQILSTPGQVALSERRELLLRSADSVIMVVASQENALERATQCYEEMAPWLAEAGRDVPIGLVLQCNKQDLPHAIPPEELSRALGLPCGEDVYATSATTGKGLRAAFVAGVRNAVERARALVESGVVLGRPDVLGGEDLFERMRREVAPLESRRPQAAASTSGVSAPGASKSSPPKTSSPRASQPAPAARATRPEVARTSAAARPSNAAAGGPTTASASARPSTKPSRSGLFPASSTPARRPAHRENGALDPAGAAARAWRPGMGPRPAIIPATAYYTWGTDGKTFAGGTLGSSAEPPGAAPVAGERLARQRSRAADVSPTRSTYVAGGVRPAVMPASAYFAALAQKGGSPGAAAGARAEPLGEVTGAAAALAASAEVPAAQTRNTAAVPSKGLARALELERELEAIRSQAPERATPRVSEGQRAEPPSPKSAGAWPPAPRREPTPRAARPAVMPASAWRSSFRGGEATDQGGSSEAQKAELELPARAASSSAASEAAPAGASALAPPARQVVDPSVFGLETSAFVDESSESFRIPESPELQALVHPGAEPGSRGAEPGKEAIAERFDSMLVPSLAAAASQAASETPPFDFSGPRPPGQAQPRAVWRRACWRALENQLSVHASALRDARGRWIGELAPGWFARTLRHVPDERAARRAFAEQVLRERQLATHLSRPRCCVLTEEAGGFWVWQVACRVPTLATILRPRLAANEPPGSMAAALLDAALGYLDAHQRFVQAKVPLPLSPHALSFQDGKVVYSGLMPDPGAVFVEPAGNGYAAFQDTLRKMWPDAAVGGSLVLAELESKASGRLPEPLLEIIRGVVGHR